MGALIAMAVIWMAGASCAQAAVYWGGSYGIGAAGLDGSEPQAHYFKPPFPADSSAPLCGVAASSAYLYWAGAFGLGRVNLEGPAAPATLVPQLYQPCGIAVDAAHVYWGNPQTHSLGRANLDGSEANTALVTGIEEPCDVAVAGGYVYWVGRHGVGRARVDGSEPQPELLPPLDEFDYLLSESCGLAVDAQHVYLGQREGIARANLDGSEYENHFITGLGSVSAIAVDGGHIYWADRPGGMSFSSVGRANLDGTEANRNWVATELFSLGGVAVDDRPSPPPLPLPSRPVQLGRVTHDLHTGGVVVAVEVPERGELAVTSAGLSWKVLKGPEPPSWRGGSFTWHLKLWPGRSGRVAKRIRAQLRRRGSAPVTLRVAFSEERQLPVGAEKQWVLRKRLHRGRSA